jgi:hypothetical protein
MIIRSGGNRLAVLGVGALLAAAVFAGCGGGDDSGELSKDEFIAQADQICADLNETAKADQEEFQALLDQGDLMAAADNFDQTAATSADALAELEALVPPAEDQATIDEWLEILNEQPRLTDEFSAALRAGDVDRIDAIGPEVQSLDAESDAIADEYGMVDCGSAGNV